MLHHTKHSASEKQENQMVVKYLRQENPSWESRSFPKAQLCLLLFAFFASKIKVNSFIAARSELFFQKALHEVPLIISRLARRFGSLGTD